MSGFNNHLLFDSKRFSFFLQDRPSVQGRRNKAVVVIIYDHMARGKASWALGYFGLPRSSAGSRRGSLLGICTACDKNEAYFQLQRNLLYCLAPTLSQATDQVDRVGMVPCTLSIKSALDWVPMPGIRLASKRETQILSQI